MENSVLVKVKRSRMSGKLFAEAAAIEIKREAVRQDYWDKAARRLPPWKIARFVSRNMPALPVS